jgi:TonB-dependent SusC/RagA subfamily outer membrane receptor
VDGVAITAEQIKEVTPDRIQEVSIIRDSIATALYGPLAANGVILITMKK